jgi:hypothetical protein
VRLGRYFGNSAQFWLDLQSQYDIAVVEREKGGEIAKRVVPANLVNSISVVETTRTNDVGIAGRYRDDSGELRQKRSDTLVGTLRQTYGGDFAKGYRGNEKLSTVLRKEKVESLSGLIKRRKV